MGSMVTINQVIDQDTACIVVEEMGHKYKLTKVDAIEDTPADSRQKKAPTKRSLVRRLLP